ncbi:MAG: transcriptional regulator [Lentisphaerae bacterium GWF2_44_16]|nr:MAG: transcriptional regulator [Lentisphaerae bacterium GWF2_44_16]
MNKADTEKLTRVFKVLSIDTRVKMLELLKERSLCVNALARILNITQAAVSQHLRILRDADILKAEKRGYFVHYSVNEKVLKRWREMAEELLNMDVK